MPKHWGIQYENRMIEFSKNFVSNRLHVADLHSKRVRADKEAAERLAEEEGASRLLESAEAAVRILMAIGPLGLSKLEGEARGRQMDHAPHLKAIGPRRCETAACREDGF